MHTAKHCCQLNLQFNLQPIGRENDVIWQYVEHSAARRIDRRFHGHGHMPICKHFIGKAASYLFVLQSADAGSLSHSKPNNAKTNGQNSPMNRPFSSFATFMHLFSFNCSSPISNCVQTSKKKKTKQRKTCLIVHSTVITMLTSIQYPTPVRCNSSAGCIECRLQTQNNDRPRWICLSGAEISQTPNAIQRLSLATKAARTKTSGLKLIWP